MVMGPIRVPFTASFEGSISGSFKGSFQGLRLRGPVALKGSIMRL